VTGNGGNKNLLSDRTLSELIEHFSTQTLSIANLPEDELGNGYEYLIKRFADDSGHTAQEFYTNRTLVHLMTRMLQPEPGESVYDPTCVTGDMLISTAAELKRQGKEWRNLRLYGQELNYGTSAIARMNLFLHGVIDGQIAHGDTLAKPAFHDQHGRLQTFDVVLANPPYSIKAWNRDAFAKDPYGRNMWGAPPQDRPRRHPLPTRRPVPPRRGGPSGSRREVRPDRVRPRTRCPVLARRPTRDVPEHRSGCRDGRFVCQSWDECTLTADFRPGLGPHRGNLALGRPISVISR